MSIQSEPAIDSPSLFARNRYAVLRGLVSHKDCVALQRYSMVLSTSDMMQPDPQGGNAPSRYADPQMELLLEDLLPLVEKASGLELYPTYAYFRVYRTGDQLKRHIDRPSCEVSLSLNLGYDAPGPWGLWVEGPNGVHCAELEPGDALLYRGCECPHWREPFAGKHNAQVFLHYVDRNGPNAAYRFDCRDALKAAKVSIRGMGKGAK